MPEYKHGKIERTINLDIFKKLQERFTIVDRGGYPVEFCQALLAALYWSGFRISEWIGGLPHKVKHKRRERQPDGSILIKTVEVTLPAFPPLLKEQMWVDAERLYVRQVARKHGHRPGAISIPLDLLYVNYIVAIWKNTAPGKPVFQISSVTWWRILKRVDPKLYNHFFILNRLTKQAEDKDTSLKDQEDWSGKSPQTIAIYRAMAGRDTKETGERMRRET